jgi:integrase
MSILSDTIKKSWFTILNDSNIPQSVKHYREETLQILAKEHPRIYAAENNVSLAPEEAERLAAKLVENTTTDGYMHRFYFFCRILDYGRSNLNWDVYVPGPPAVIRRPKNPFSPEEINTSEANAMAKRLINDLSCPAPQSMTQRAGQVLLSAILFGGLLQPSKHLPFLKSLPHMCRTSEGELIVPLTPSENEQVTLWHADPVTHGLLLRWWREYQSDSEYFDEIRSPDKALSAYVKQLYPEFSITIPKLRQQCRQRLALRIPPFLINYALGLLNSVSLPPSTWQRLITNMALNQDFGKKPAPEATSGQNSSDVRAAVPPCIDPGYQIDRWKELQREVRKKNSHAEFRHALEIFLEKNRGKLLPALYYIIQWGIELVTNISPKKLIFYPGRDHHRLRPSSAMEYMGNIAKNLITAAADEDLADMEEEELRDLYSETIALCPVSSNQRGSKISIAQRCGETLRRFNGFLQVRYNFPPLNFSDLTAADYINVDANLISFDEYDRLQTVLAPDYDQANGLQKMRSLVAMLAFKCGLRRGECLRLRLCDLHPGLFPELLIRSSRYGRTKSLSSVRKLPLYALLEKTELQRFLAFHKVREMETGKPFSEALLFCDANQTMPADQALMTPIRLALHQVTGDGSLRFHHLRHSFATWTLVRFLITDLPPTSARFLNHPAFSPASCLDLKKNLLGNSEGRQILYELARLVGHESPETTLLHYVHMLDWLLARALSEHCESAISVKAIANLTGLSPNQIYYQPRSKSPDSSNKPPCRLSSYLSCPNAPPCFCVPLTAPNTRELKTTQLDKHADFSRLPAIIHRVLSTLANGQPISALARALDYSEDNLKQWQRTAAWIRKLTTNQGISRHLNTATREKGFTVFPLPCKTKSEKELQQRIFAKVSNFEKSEHENLKEFLLFFLQNNEISAKGIQHSNEQLTQEYLLRLLALGIHKKEILVILHLPETHQEAMIREANRLRSLFSNAGNFFVKSCPPPKKRTYLTTVRVINPEDRRNSPPQDIYYANYGFRSAMYLLAIALFADSDLPSPQP